jgi:hypothetical protein
MADRDLTDEIPDRVSLETDSPYFFPQWQRLGVRINGGDSVSVVEFCVSEGSDISRRPAENRARPVRHGDPARNDRAILEIACMSDGNPTGPERLTDIQIVGMDGSILLHVPDPVPDANGKFTFPLQLDLAQIREMVLTFEGGRQLVMPRPDGDHEHA